MTEEVKEVKPAKENQSKELVKKLLDLQPLFVTKFGPKLKPRAKIVYYVLSCILGLAALWALAQLFINGLTAFIIDAVLIAIAFVVVRMFSEYLYND